MDGNFYALQVQDPVIVGADTEADLARRVIVDLSFNAADGEVVYLPRTSDLRAPQRMTQRVRLVATDENGERTLGVYTFNHQVNG